MEEETRRRRRRRRSRVGWGGMKKRRRRNRRTGRRRKRRKRKTKKEKNNNRKVQQEKRGTKVEGRAGPNDKRQVVAGQDTQVRQVRQAERSREGLVQDKDQSKKRSGNFTIDCAKII